MKRGIKLLVNLKITQWIIKMKPTNSSHTLTHIYRDETLTPCQVERSKKRRLRCQFSSPQLSRLSPTVNSLYRSTFLFYIFFSCVAGPLSGTLREGFCLVQRPTTMCASLLRDVTSTPPPIPYPWHPLLYTEFFLEKKIPAREEREKSCLGGLQPI